MNPQLPLFYDEFVAQIELITNVFHFHLSKDLNEKIVICTSPNIKDHIYVQENEKTSECISVQEFLNIVIKRWEEEYYYEQEIVNIKNKVYEAFYSLWEEKEDILFHEFLDTQALSIIEEIFSLIKFDERQIASEFCKGLLNGFDSDLPKTINRVACYVLFKPLFKPYPIGFIEYMKPLMDDIKKKINKENVHNVTEKLLCFVRDYFKEILYIDCDNKFVGELNEQLQKIAEERKICHFIFNNLNFNASEIIPLLNKHSKTCIETIRIVSKYDKFLQFNIKMAYESLSIVNLISAANAIQIFNKIPRNVQELCLKFANLMPYEMKKLLVAMSKLFGITKIDFQFNNNAIGNKEAEQFFFVTEKLSLYELIISGISVMNIVELNIKYIFIHKSSETGISSAEFDKYFQNIQNLTKIKQFSLNISNNNFIGSSLLVISSFLEQLNILDSLSLGLSRITNLDKISLEKLSFALSKLLTLNKIKLDLSYGKVYNEGIISVMDGLAKLQSLREIDLNWGCNEIENLGFESTITTLANLNSLRSLKLNFMCNKMNSVGLINVEKIFGKMTKLEYLSLNLSSHEIDGTGIEALSSFLSHLKAIKILDLSLENNQINIDALKKLFGSIEHLINLNSLSLHLRGSLSGKVAQEATEALKISVANLLNKIDPDNSKKLIRSNIEKELKTTFYLSSIMLKFVQKLLKYTIKTSYVIKQHLQCI